MLIDLFIYLFIFGERWLGIVAEVHNTQFQLKVQFVFIRGCKGTAPTYNGWRLQRGGGHSVWNCELVDYDNLTTLVRITEFIIFNNWWYLLLHLLLWFYNTVLRYTLLF